MNPLDSRISKGPGRLLGGLLAFLVTCGTMLPLSAPASLVVPLTVEEMVAVAEDVVQVKVTKGATEWYNGKIVTHYDLEVVDSIKGSRRASDHVSMTMLGGQRGKLASISPGAPVLEDGEEAIVFLSNPVNRMSAEQANHLNMDSPLVQSPQLVGGFQGKFEIEHKTIQEQVGTRTVEREILSVKRDNPGNALHSAPPTLDAFKSQLRQVVTRGSRSAMPRKIATVGEVAVTPEDPSATALRMFDPLPPMAKEDPKEIRRKLEARRIKAQKATASEAEQGTDPASGANAESAAPRQ